MEKIHKKLNPQSTTDPLTPFLIGSYHEISICIANYDKALKILYHKLEHETYTVSYTLSDWFNI